MKLSVTILRRDLKIRNMVLFGFLNIKDKWLLALIDSVPYVEGRTRLQKYGILSFNEVLSSKEFFDDWKADNFGGFSLQLAKSLNKLERHECVQVTEVITEYGTPVSRYTLTEKGKGLVREFIKRNSLRFEKIKSITSNYFQKPLKILLDDVYQKYPDFTKQSKIKADVNKTKTLNHSYLSPEYEFSNKNEIEEIPTSTVPAQQHVFGDEDFRNKLANSIGLNKAPDLDPSSFERIKGILSKRIDTEDFDSEELVKEVRGC